MSAFTRIRGVSDLPQDQQVSNNHLDKTVCLSKNSTPNFLKIYALAISSDLLKITTTNRSNIDNPLYKRLRCSAMSSGVEEGLRLMLAVNYLRSKSQAWLDVTRESYASSYYNEVGRAARLKRDDDFLSNILKCFLGLYGS